MFFLYIYIYILIFRCVTSKITSPESYAAVKEKNMTSKEKNSWILRLPNKGHKVSVLDAS